MTVEATGLNATTTLAADIIGTPATFTLAGPLSAAWPTSGLIHVNIGDTESIAGTISGTTVTVVTRAVEAIGAFTTAQNHTAGDSVKLIFSYAAAKSMFPYKFFDSTLGGASATIAIPASGSIPGGGMDIELICSVRGDTAANNVTMTVRFNGDVGADYFDEINAQSGTTTTVPVEDTGTTSFRCGNISAATASANSFSRVGMRISDYTAAHFKAVMMTLNRLDTGSAGGDTIGIASGWWNQTGAITSITLSVSAGNFAAGSRVVGYIWP